MSVIGRAIDKAVAKVGHRVRGMIQRAVLSSLSDSDGVQVVKVKLVGDHVREAEHFQPAGLTSSPTAGTGVCLMVGANSDHAVLVGLSNPSKRPTGLAAGDTTLYDEHDNRVDLHTAGIRLHQGGAVDFVALAAKVLVELNDIRTRFDAHIHTTTATIGIGGVGVISPPTAAMGGASSVAAAKVEAE